jgi:hypothetical protein
MRFIIALPLICSLGAISLPSAQAATLVASYPFSNSLNAVQGGAPALVASNPLPVASRYVTDTVFGQSDTVYVFGGPADPATSQGGLSLNTTGLVPAGSYSIAMSFMFNDLNDWRRILDTQHRSIDNGFYVNGDRFIDAYGDGGNNGGPALSAGTYYQVVLTVDANNLQGFVNGTLAFTASGASFLNLNSTASEPANILNIFLDNTADSFQNDYSSGRIAQLQLFSGALTPAEVTALFNTQLIPEPGSSAFLAIAVTAPLLRRKRGAQA